MSLFWHRDCSLAPASLSTCSERLTGARHREGIVKLSNVKLAPVVAFALITLAAGAAQAQDPAPSAASTPGATGRDQSPVAQPVNAAERLATAATILESIQDSDLKSDAKDLLIQLKKHFSEMTALHGKAAANTEDRVVERQISPTVPVGTSGTKSDGEKNDWKEKFSQVERDLASLVGGGPSTGTSPVQPAPGAGLKNLPAGIATQLNDFRIQIELFYAASMGQSLSKNRPQ